MAALFAASPLIVSTYAPAAALLGVDWYEAIREAEAPTAGTFTPTPQLLVSDESVKAVTAIAVEPVRTVERVDPEVAAKVVRDLGDGLKKATMSGFRDTITRNAVEDPISAGWRRYARPEACKFCKMLADRGAVYEEATVRFAAHGALMRGGRKGGECMCLAGPSFDPDAPKASVMQYVASRESRTPEQRERLRDHLNANFPDARG